MNRWTLWWPTSDERAWSAVEQWLRSIHRSAPLRRSSVEHFHVRKMLGCSCYPGKTMKIAWWNIYTCSALSFVYDFLFRYGSKLGTRGTTSHPVVFFWLTIEIVVSNFDPYTYLVGGLKHFLFFHILGIIIPTDFHVFEMGGSTTNQLLLLFLMDIATRHESTQVALPICRQFGLRYNFFSEHHPQAGHLLPQLTGSRGKDFMAKRFGIIRWLSLSL